MLSSLEYLKNYLKTYDSLIHNESNIKKLIQVKNIFQKTSHAGEKIIFAGNGGSATMASHIAVDLTKNAGIRAVTFNEYDLITTLANDYGFDNWIAKAIEFYHNTGDVVVLISASGKSTNVLKAADKAKEIGLQLITFSGFFPQNNLRKLGEINLWVDSKTYNIVEMTHHIWLLAIVDMIINENK